MGRVLNALSEQAIDWLVAEYGIQEIIFLDDNLALARDREPGARAKRLAQTPARKRSGAKRARAEFETAARGGGSSKCARIA